MGVATCRMVSETDPPDRTKERERCGEGIERGGIGPSGGPALSAKLAWGGIFLPRVTLLKVGDRWVR